MPRRSAGAAYIYGNAFNFAPEATDLTGTGALDLTSQALGFTYELDEFGFIVTTALVGGSQSYDLVDSANNVIATVALTAAAGGKAAWIKTSAFTVREVLDGTVLKIRRRAGGTTVSAGTGTFYVRYRQQLQGKR